jgi:hypothetical protein
MEKRERLSEETHKKDKRTDKNRSPSSRISAFRLCSDAFIMRDTVEDSGDFVKPWKRDRMKNGRKSKKKQERDSRIGKKEIDDGRVLP